MTSSAPRPQRLAQRTVRATRPARGHPHPYARATGTLSGSTHVSLSPGPLATETSLRVPRMRRTGTAGRRKSQENVTTGKLAAVILTAGFIPSTLCEMAGESDGHGPARPWTAEWGPPSGDPLPCPLIWPLQVWCSEQQQAPRELAGTRALVPSPGLTESEPLWVGPQICISNKTPGYLRLFRLKSTDLLHRNHLIRGEILQILTHLTNEEREARVDLPDSQGDGL